MDLTIISLTALIGWAIFQFTGCVLLFITAVIESKFIYYLKKGVN